MKTTYLTFTFFLLVFTSCSDDCQTCTKTIGGIAGNVTDEVREVCDDDEANDLIDSSTGTTIWTCE